MKIKNCYFPLFVSPGVLEKEKDHIEGFAPEVNSYAHICLIELWERETERVQTIKQSWLCFQFDQNGELLVEFLGFFCSLLSTFWIIACF